MLQLIHSLLQSFAMNRAMKEPSEGDQCVACEGRNVTLLGPAAYRCNDCGYEGGDGWAARAQAERAAAIRQMPVERRHASARQHLLEARRLLLAGVGEIERARSLSRLDIVGLSPMSYGEVMGEGHEKQDALTSGVGLLLEAKQLVQTAEVELGISLGEAARAEGGGLNGAVAAFDLYMDNVFADALAHRNIVQTLDQARAMQSAVEMVLIREFGEPSV